MTHRTPERIAQSDHLRVGEGVALMKSGCERGLQGTYSRSANETVMPKNLVVLADVIKAANKAAKDDCRRQSRI